MSSKEPRTNAVGVILRVLTLFFRFALVIYLTRYFSIEALGVYGLLSATILIVGPVLGLEFFHYAEREVLRVAPEDRPPIVWSQWRCHSVMYVIGLPLTILILLTGLIPMPEGLWLYPLCIFNHACSESFRYLVVVMRPRAAFISSFGSGALWIPFVIVLGFISPSFRTLNWVFGLWTVAAGLNAIVSWWYLYKTGLLKGGPKVGSWKIVRQGLKVCLLFLIMAACSRLGEYGDRYVLKVFSGDTEVGIYTFYQRIASTMYDLLYAGLISVDYPRLVAAFKQGQNDLWKTELTRFSRRLLGSIFLLVPFYIVGVYLLLWMVDRPVIADRISVYFVLIAGQAIVCASMIPHMVLYSRGHDYALLICAITVMVASLTLNVVLVPAYGALGAALASAGSMTILGLLKLAIQRRYPVSPDASG